MPRLRRIVKLQRRDWPRGALLHAVTGIAFSGSGFGYGDGGEDFDAAWARAYYESHRQEVFDEFARRNARGGIVRLRPAFWWNFESSEPRDFDIDEAAQLRRMGEST